MTKGSQTIGMIGVGLMGHGIALNIAKSGRKLLFLDHSGNQDTADLVALGAEPVAACAEIASRSEAVVICVTGTPQVEDVLFREDGLLKGISQGMIIIDCSTALPASTIEIAQTVAAAGGHFLDAPMTRTPKEAAEGRLNLIVGGDRALFDACLPLFESFAENITYGGGPGAGHTLKLIHNYVSLGFSAVLSEAAKTANLSNVSPEKLVEVLETGAGAGPILQRFKPFLKDHNTEAFTFAIANAAKDMGYFTAMADDLDAPVKVAASVQHLYQDLVEGDHGHRYLPEVIDLIG